MSDFINKLQYTADLDKINHDLDQILNNYCSWNVTKQIGLRHRDNCENHWLDASGGLDSAEHEQLFCNWNPDCPEYTKSVLQELAEQENISWGRIRFMCADSKQGLSMHYDHQPRYHLVLKTNPSAVFGECFNHHQPIRATCYHIPANGHWYKVDTTREHFVFNAGLTPRIHLVCCPV